MRISTSTGNFVTRPWDEQITYTRKHRIGKFQLEQALEALNALYATKGGKFQLRNVGGWYNLSWVRLDGDGDVDIVVKIGSFPTKRLYFMMAYAVSAWPHYRNVVGLLRRSSGIGLSRFGVGDEHVKSRAL